MIVKLKELVIQFMIQTPSHTLIKTSVIQKHERELGENTITLSFPKHASIKLTNATRSVTAFRIAIACVYFLLLSRTHCLKLSR